MKFLIVGDKSRIGGHLWQGLSETDFAINLVHNGLDGRYLVMTGDYDLLILGVMLPDPEGQQILYVLHSTELVMPVLFLTARNSVTDRVKGLELGADDCMVKPSAFAELLIRVRTLLQRDNAPPLAGCIQVADPVLDLTRRRTSRGGQQITLTSKEFLLLELLVCCHGEVLPRSLIASQVWDMNFDSDTNVIDVVIQHLCVKIDDNFKLELIRTVRDMGYVLEGPEDGEQRGAIH